jgi:hypothetical protein
LLIKGGCIVLMSSSYDKLTSCDVDVTRKLSVFKHRKKEAANDAQLLMNRIALLQKEEERARKKIDHTRERAIEILDMRSENESKMKNYMEVAGEHKAKQDLVQKKNRSQAAENQKNIQIQTQILLETRRGRVLEMRDERKKALKSIIKDQQAEVKRKQKQRDTVRRLEEEAAAKKEAEKARQDKIVRDQYEAKAAAEESEARRAEKLVKALEKKEREWIEKLRMAQKTQENAFEYLEETLLTKPDDDDMLPPQSVSKSHDSEKSMKKKKSP